MFLEAAYRLALFFSFLVAVAVIHILGTLTVCRLTRVKMTKIAVFFGKPIFTFNLPLCPLSFGYIPAGGYVQLDMNEFPKRPLIIRCLVILAGPVLIFMIAALILTFARAGGLFKIAFPEFIHGALSPKIVASALISRFFNIAHEAPVVGFGIFAVKFVAANMVPFPALPGGRVIVEALHIQGKTFQRVQALCSLIALPIVIAWAYAFVRCL